jgi:hypothetical protein
MVPGSIATLAPLTALNSPRGVLKCFTMSRTTTLAPRTVGTASACRPDVLGCVPLLLPPRCCSCSTAGKATAVSGAASASAAAKTGAARCW